MRDIEIAEGEYYHIYNRGVDKQVLFRRNKDFERFLLLLYFCNRPERLPRELSIDTTLSVVHTEDRLASVCCYTVMPNHFHVKLQQIHPDGIQQLLQRVQMAYAKYNNKLRERKGRLFESTYQCVHVGNEAQWLHLTNYIHLNPLDLSGIPWREGASIDWKKAKAFLDSYPWSSYRAFSGKKEVLPIIDEEYLHGRAPDPDDYLEELKEWVSRNVQSLDIPGDHFDNT